MLRIIRGPRTLDKVFRPLQGDVHGDHVAYCRLLVLAMAFAWGRHHVTNVDRSLDAQHHRTRVHNFFLVPRWHPEAARRQKAQELLRALAPQPGNTGDLSLDDAKKGPRGKRRDAVAPPMSGARSSAESTSSPEAFGSTSSKRRGRP